MGELLSVIVPVYNSEKYLRRCVDSILNQTYKNLEILLVDDGSTDSSFSICKEYEERDPRVKVIHQENGGASAARNAGIMACKNGGGYITFVDSDDSILPNMYEKIMACIKEFCADIGVCDIAHPHAGDMLEKQDNSRGNIFSYNKDEILGGIIFPYLGISDNSVQAGYFNSVINKIFRKK